MRARQVISFVVLLLGAISGQTQPADPPPQVERVQAVADDVAMLQAAASQVRVSARGQAIGLPAGPGPALEAVPTGVAQDTPDPESLALWLAGVCALAFLALRRRKA